MENSKNYEINDIDADLNGVSLENVREVSQSKKFFLSKLSFENLKRVCSKIRYFGNRGMEKLSDNIATVKEELNDEVAAKETLESKMQTSPEIKSINDRIIAIQNSDLAEEDKEKALETPEKEKEEIINDLQKEIDEREKSIQSKEEKIDYLKSIEKEKQEKMIRKAEEKRTRNNVFDDIKVNEESKVNERLAELDRDIKEHRLDIVSEELAKQSEQYMTAVEEGEFAGLDEYYDNFLKQLEDVESSVNTLRNSYKAYTKTQIQNLKSAQEDAIKRLKENYEDQLRKQKKQHKKEIDDYNVTFNLKDREIRELNEKVASLNGNLENNLYQLSEKDNTINKLENDNRKLNQKLSSKDLEISALKQEKEKAIADNSALRGIIERFKSQNAMLKSQNAMLESQNKMLSEQNKTISEQNEGLINLVDQFNNDGFSVHESNSVEDPGISMIKK